MLNSRYANGFRVSLLAGLAVLFSGCDESRPELVPVSGVVLIDGKPLQHGTIRVMPEEKRSAFGDIDGEGRFTLFTYKLGDGCALGRHKVLVNGLEVLNESSQRWNAPEKYARASSTDIFVDISEPTDNLKIELTWNGGKPFVERPNR